MAVLLARKKRRNFDVHQLMVSHHVVVLREPNAYLVKFYGPSGTPYENGVWNVKLLLSEEYPFEAPVVGFTNVIVHPNIDRLSGNVCLDVLNESWLPAYNLSIIFNTFLPHLLVQPNPNDPLNSYAAFVSISKPQFYLGVIKAAIDSHATEEIANRKLLEIIALDESMLF